MHQVAIQYIMQFYQITYDIAIAVYWDQILALESLLDRGLIEIPSPNTTIQIPVDETIETPYSAPTLPQEDPTIEGTAGTSAVI
jgi:hypothetical protein